MKRLFSLFAALMLVSNVAVAAEGDTTWVQAHSDIWMDHYGAFDTAINFPDGTKSYRKVYMIFTLGKYTCPGSPQYCGDWDYTVNNYLMTPGGDTIELGRFITPYANVSYPRTPLNWKQRYVWDVTDFYPLLKNNATVRINYQGYSWGFSANVKFAFVEGTPARNVLGINRLWNGGFNFGGATGINDLIATQSLTAPANAQFAEMKFNISGHGADNNGCSEFCKKYYQVMLNGNQLEQKDIWRANCGSNHIYPQSGTWVYDRGNWCPGDIVFTNTHKLNGITGGNSYSLDVDFENYTSPNGGAVYGIDAAVVYYGAYNRNTDISLENIIAPTDHETYFRENPASEKPTVEVMNTGRDTVKSIRFEYSVNQSMTYYYTWTGALASMEKAQITLPEMYDMRALTGSANTFTVQATQVNGSADGDASNNKLTSTFTAAPQWPMGFAVNFRTNLVAETSWKILDGLGNTVAQRTNTNTGTTYVDTVRLGPGAYRFVVTDDGCDGLSFWANPGAGTGSLAVRRIDGIGTLALKGYLSGDFGCGFTQAFNINWPTAITNVAVQQAAMQVYPNPANSRITVSIEGGNVQGTISIADIAGRPVMQQACHSAETDINTTALAAGVYYLSYYSTDGHVKLISKLVITK